MIGLTNKSDAGTKIGNHCPTMNFDEFIDVCVFTLLMVGLASPSDTATKNLNYFEREVLEGF